MTPVSIQVIAYAPTAFYHCQHCELTFREMGIGERLHRQEAAHALPDDLLRDYANLSTWIHRVLDRHGGRVRVRIIDAASIEGFLASIRHRIGRYPAVIVDGDKRVGSDFEAMDPLIDRRVSAATGTAHVPEDG